MRKKKTLKVEDEWSIGSEFQVFDRNEAVISEI